jgi:hypothetical protein
MLTLGTRGRLFGSVGFEVAGGPDAQRLVLEFPIKSISGDRLNPARQIICCYWRKAHYGGRYLMFLCSECSRSARVLYARYFYDRICFFNCRQCAGITYQSTMGHRWDRSARRIEKLRARLEWQAAGTVPIRPRGMHERTYQRILGALAYHEAVRKSRWPARWCDFTGVLRPIILPYTASQARSTRKPSGIRCPEDCSKKGQAWWRCETPHKFDCLGDRTSKPT